MSPCDLPKIYALAFWPSALRIFRQITCAHITTTAYICTCVYVAADINDFPCFIPCDPYSTMYSYICLFTLVKQYTYTASKERILLIRYPVSAPSMDMLESPGCTFSGINSLSSCVHAVVAILLLAKLSVMANIHMTLQDHANI